MHNGSVITLVRADGLAPWTSVKSLLKFTWAQIPRASHKRLIIATAVYSALSVVDFISVLAVAAVMALVVASLTPDGGAGIGWIGSSFETPIGLVGTLGLAAVVLLGLKTLLAWRLMRRIYIFTAKLQPIISGRVYGTYLSSPFPAAQMLSMGRVNNAVTAGSLSLINSLRSVIAIVADISLLTLMMALMLVASPILFIAAAAYFGLLATVTAKLLGNKMAYYGQESARAAIAATETVLVSVGYAPEIRLYGMAEKFGQRLSAQQKRLAEVNGLQQVMHLAPRYVFEVGMLAGFIGVASVALLLQSPAEAAFTIAVFALASVRMVPSLQRLNASWGQLKQSKGQSVMLETILELPHSLVTSEGEAELGDGSALAVALRGVDYAYPNAEQPSLTDINLDIVRGSTTAIVGKTGSGKSTLAAVIAGLVTIDKGTIHRAEGENWAEKLAVVRQVVYLSPDSVRDNIAVSVVGQEADDSLIWRSLTAARVADVVASLPQGLDTQLGESGARLSGGEAQRLGLARALYRQPSLLVLDEATSSLDSQTELDVTTALHDVVGECTIVVIAHRLATVRNADHIVYMKEGRIEGQGTFNELVSLVPDFAESAALQGLLPK
jgi:ATP-binding cassette, subfamily B, bacterial PglK